MKMGYRVSLRFGHACESASRTEINLPCLELRILHKERKAYCKTDLDSMSVCGCLLGLYDRDLVGICKMVGKEVH